MENKPFLSKKHGDKDFKIPRPPNAFMIFSRENRTSFRLNYPNDSNQEISIRLGNVWRRMNPEGKAIYYQKAKECDRKHKETYPGYIYRPRRNCKPLKQKKMHSSFMAMTDSLPESIVKVNISESEHTDDEDKYSEFCSTKKALLLIPTNKIIKRNVSTQTDDLTTRTLHTDVNRDEATEEEKSAWLSFLNNFSQSKEAEFENVDNSSPIVTEHLHASEEVSNAYSELTYLLPLEYYQCVPVALHSAISQF
ncbi:sex-determining region Y protein-like [Centruroides sculpturatus]|uniref:sex-determining region Y protein-like n=1 Tax=Centruroides sculpturatus TaxID=218467 RepID=UPI000C6DC7AE|nr:sex-determining region Y protein-like [Centruroides sculpturatus]